MKPEWLIGALPLLSVILFESPGCKRIIGTTGLLDEPANNIAKEKVWVEPIPY